MPRLIPNWQPAFSVVGVSLPPKTVYQELQDVLNLEEGTWGAQNLHSPTQNPPHHSWTKGGNPATLHTSLDSPPSHPGGHRKRSARHRCSEVPTTRPRRPPRASPEADRSVRVRCQERRRRCLTWFLFGFFYQGVHAIHYQSWAKRAPFFASDRPESRPSDTKKAVCEA